MKRAAGLCCAGLLVLALAACGGREADSFSVRVLCESEGSYQIFYSAYIGGDFRSMGGMADFDGNVLTESSELELVFPRESFDEGDDIGDFSLTLSPYGEGDTSELDTTRPVPIQAEWGGRYAVVLSGDVHSGFSAQLQPEPKTQ